MMNRQELELYIHIPFCIRKCAYCDFLSFAAPERIYRDYMDKLIEEIYGQSACFQESVVTSIFLGGGTPSVLPAELVEELFAFTGVEMVKNKIDALLGPGINIHRHPLNGRNFEYFSEDPLLTGKMAAVH